MTFRWRNVTRTWNKYWFLMVRKSGLLKYLPYLFSIILMKLTVMVLLASQRNQQRTLSLRPGNFSLDITGSTESSKIPNPEQIHYWNVLNHLEKSFINATSINRTQSSSIWLIYNRIPRSGGITIVYLIKELGKIHRFSHQRHQYRTPWNRLLIEDEQKNLVTWFEYQHLAKSYDRHFLFVNFTQYQRYTRNLRPTYINILRDPAEREYSVFRGRREDPMQVAAEIRRRDVIQSGSGMEWYVKSFANCVLEDDAECMGNSTEHVFSRAIPYFCGQHPQCLVAGSYWALQRAKFIAEYEYSVVGILDRMNETLQVLEHYIPKFFLGATKLYYDAGYARRHENRYIKSKPDLSEEVRNKLKNILHMEYDLYEFCQQRLYYQYQQVTTNS